MGHPCEVDFLQPGWAKGAPGKNASAGSQGLAQPRVSAGVVASIIKPWPERTNTGTSKALLKLLKLLTEWVPCVCSTISSEGLWEQQNRVTSAPIQLLARPQCTPLGFSCLCPSPALLCDLGSDCWERAGKSLTGRLSSSLGSHP